MMVFWQFVQPALTFHRVSWIRLWNWSLFAEWYR